MSMLPMSWPPMSIPVEEAMAEDAVIDAIDAIDIDPVEAIWLMWFMAEEPIDMDMEDIVGVADIDIEDMSISIF